MASDNPLELLGTAREERHFHEKNKALIDEMRERLRRERLGEGLAASGIDDDVVLQALLAMGVEPEVLPALPLAPLLQVAWADGEVQAAERTLLVEAAQSQGLRVGSAAYEVFMGFLSTEPSPEFYGAASTYVRAMLAAMGASDAEVARSDLGELARRVAGAHGKMLGMFGSGISDEERRALDRVTEQLASSHPQAAGEVLQALRGDE